MKHLQVAVGVLFNERSEVLVGQRTVKDRYYQQWEFPGGKLEQGESAEQALVRELEEELGIQVTAAQAFMQLEHTYPDRHVELHVFTVKEYIGEPMGKEDQALQWIAPSKLDEIDFLSGNQKIVTAVQAIC